MLSFNKDIETIIALWPSPGEIDTRDENDNAYLGGLTVYYRSLDELEMDLYRTTVFNGWNREEDSDGDSPPTIAEILIWIGSSGLLSGAAVALYKVLSSWTKKVNGRRIKVKFHGFEIETTQLTEEQFVKLFQNLLELDEKMRELVFTKNMIERTALRKELLEKELSGYSVENEESLSVHKQKSHLWGLQNEVGEEIKQKLFALGEGLTVNLEDTFSDKDELPAQMSLLSEQATNIRQDQKDAASYQQEMVTKHESEQHLINVSGKTKHFVYIYLSSAFTPEDEALLNDLEKQLSMLKRQTDVYLWDRHHIVPGTEREQGASTYINQAHLILLLLSPDFFASNECYKEMELAIKRSDIGKARVIPILMRYSAGWQDTPIGKLEPLPSDREPISDRADREKAMHDIAEHIHHAVKTIRQSASEW
ncbi:hypothetical protein KSF_085850 [Reticulibacter mediterranei]|uniref:TIR domain-containing protein n=1 Tax=Reticulibacter mediterranei TaxID=2778369 RepID=A0A8J3N8S3_9CHLR|nr:toll/interleukin-1 receptor domain-containing protein [Reticulibacter mediterranei]GHO98537.1 hypothetical protein KSF_085850 [Reticulibacter mediterranei]